MDEKGYHKLETALLPELGNIDIYPPPMPGWAAYNQRYVEIRFPREVRHQQIIDRLGKVGMMDGMFSSGWPHGRLKILGMTDNMFLLEDLNYRPTPPASA